MIASSMEGRIPRLVLLAPDIAEAPTLGAVGPRAHAEEAGAATADELGGAGPTRTQHIYA